MRYLANPPGASQEQISRLEQAFGFKLPPSMLHFWQGSNGPILYFGFKELQFFSIEEMLEELEESTYQLHAHLGAVLPLCMDGCGNICFAKIENGQISSFHVVSCGSLDWGEARKISESFDIFVNDLLSPEKRLYT